MGCPYARLAPYKLLRLRGELFGKLRCAIVLQSSWLFTEHQGGENLKEIQRIDHVGINAEG